MTLNNNFLFYPKWKCVGFAYQVQGKYKDSEKAFQEALRILENAIGNENPIASDLLSSLADSCVMQGKYDAAMAHYTRIIAIDERIFSADNRLRVEHLQSYGNLLKLMRSTNRVAQVEQRIRKTY